VTRSVDERLADILNAIARARIADERLQASAAAADATGEQLAFDAILHNLFVIGEAVKALPPELLELDPDTPWREIASMRDVIGHHYHRVVPAVIHGTVTNDLDPLETAVIRLRDRR
jgi:uncharacterized protein with HEPN domain